MNFVRAIGGIAVLLALAGCVSGEGPGDVVPVLATPNPQPSPQIPPRQSYALDVNRTPTPHSSYQAGPASHSVTLAPQPVYVQRESKTYLINGLASNVGAIGYGFANLQKKIPGSVLHSYASPLESSTIIRSQVIKELKAAYRTNPDLDINLVGISYGANIVTQIAATLGRSKIPVNYLATLEGPAMSRIGPNVRVADNFKCTHLTCFRTSSKLSRNNRTTRFQSFAISASHIALANHPRVHNRIISQLASHAPQPQIFAQ